MKKALIVEDDNDSANGFRTLLSGMGFDCTVDPYGDMAIKYFDSLVSSLSGPDASRWGSSAAEIAKKRKDAEIKRYKDKNSTL